MEARHVFVTGATGYLGRPLVAQLLARTHSPGPYILLPLYAVLSWLPQTREGARRLGLVTRNQMVRALVHAVEHPDVGVRIMEVPEIRAGAAA